jgi:murein DD-endopeptidase MepM/ murein hydrolase activator NlpD
MSIREPVPGYAHRAPGSGFSPWHQAVDIPAPGGTPVVAVGAGLVVAAGEDQLTPYNLDLAESGGGNIVVVRHRMVDAGALGLGTMQAESQYAHLRSISPMIRKGLLVPAGFPLGQVGATGNATGNHLHFGFRVGGVWRDYREFLPGGSRTGALLDAQGAVPGGSPLRMEDRPPTVAPRSDGSCPPGYFGVGLTGPMICILDPLESSFPALGGVSAALNAASSPATVLDTAGDIARNFGLFLLFAVILILGLWALVRSSGS